MREVAAASGISASFLSRLESGAVKRPSDEVLLGLARGLDVDPQLIRSDLMAGHTAPPALYLPADDDNFEVPEHLLRVAMPMVRQIIHAAENSDLSMLSLECSVRELLAAILRELDAEQSQNQI